MQPASSPRSENRAIAPLIALLREDDSDVQWRSAFALSLIGEPAVDSLILALKDRNWWVRVRAVWALGEIRDKRAVEPLIQSVNDQDWYVRWSAADALGKIGDKRAALCLGKALKEADSFVQVPATWALGKLGSNAPVEDLILSLKNSDWYVRWGAADALGNIGDPRGSRFPYHGTKMTRTNTCERQQKKRSGRSLPKTRIVRKNFRR